MGSNDRVNDSAVFRNSVLNSAMENNLLNWPDNSIIIGNDTFPFRNTLLKPYSKLNLTLKQKYSTTAFHVQGEFLKMRLVYRHKNFAFSVGQLN